MKSRLRQRKTLMTFIFAILLCVGVGFAAFSATFTALGNGTLIPITWKVYVEKVIPVEGSVEPTVAPKVNEGDKGVVSLNYSVTLTKPEDVYKFDFVVKNEGSMAIMIGDTPLLSGLDETQSEYFSHELLTADGNQVKVGDVIEAGGTKKYRIRVLFKDVWDLFIFEGDEDINLNLNVTIPFVQYSDYFDRGVYTLIQKSNDLNTMYVDGEMGEMYAFEHSKGPNINGKIKDYRFIGSNPNNYIEFNEETWRILGVFLTDDGTGREEERIKIIRDEALPEFRKWAGTVKSDNFSESSINKYLNGEGGYYDNMTEKAKKQISNAAYQLGRLTYDSSNNSTASGYYNEERFSTSYTTKIGLMYPSDFAYTLDNGAGSSCDRFPCSLRNANEVRSWLGYNKEEWTMNGYKDTYNSETVAVAWLSHGANDPDPAPGFVNFSIGYASVDLNNFAIRPVAYLRENIRLTGTGTKIDPYKIVN